MTVVAPRRWSWSKWNWVTPPILDFIKAADRAPASETAPAG